jgi:hypothetical protein
MKPLQRIINASGAQRHKIIAACLACAVLVGGSALADYCGAFQSAEGPPDAAPEQEAAPAVVSCGHSDAYAHQLPSSWGPAPVNSSFDTSYAIEAETQPDTVSEGSGSGSYYAPAHYAPVEAMSLHQ